MIRKWIHYSRDDVWRSRIRDLTGFRLFRVKFLRIAVLSFRGFFKNQLRASALTYYSVLSVVPVFALLLGIAKGFGYQKMLQNQLMKALHGQEEIVSKISHFAHSLLSHTQSGVIAGVGLVFLFYSVISVLISIEGYFNEIWHVQKGRTPGRMIADYLSFMLIAPVLFIISSAITVFVTAEVKIIVQKIDLLGSMSPMIFFLLSFSPYVTMWLLFTFMYLFMPNTRVRFVSGALAGLIGGSIFQLFQWVYITFQIGVARYNTIYGSFAALPLFLIWLQVSWIIILIGAEISHAYQNAEAYDYEPDCERIRPSFKRLLALRVVQLLARDFSEGKQRWDEMEISHQLGIPLQLLRDILSELITSGVVSRVKTETVAGEAFQPGKDIGGMTVISVLKAMETHGDEDLPVVQTDELRNLSKAFDSFADLLENASSNRRLVDL